MTENKIKIACLICGKIVTNNNSYIGSHTKRIHKIKIFEYIMKYYSDLNEVFSYESCGFCDKQAIPEFEINHIEKTFSRKYSMGYMCYSDECKNIISLHVLGKPYDDDYEFIGSRAEFLQKRYKLATLDDAKQLKQISIASTKKKNKNKSDAECVEIYKHNKEIFDNLPKTTKLSDYIIRYGDDEGTRLYNERCEKISKSNTLQWYLDKFGIEEGTKRFNSYRDKLAKNALGKSVSKKSYIVGEYLTQLNISFKNEYNFIKQTGHGGKIDYFLPEHKIAIEFFGDFWHANPNVYEGSYYNRILKMTAKEIWKRNDNRVLDIKAFFDNKITIIILWEATSLTPELLEKTINNYRDKNTLVIL